MLALDDAALARIVIGATRVRASERGRWLQDVARKLDPPPKPVTRQGRWRQRQRKGRAIYDGGWRRAWLRAIMTTARQRTATRRRARPRWRHSPIVGGGNDRRTCA
jgi:hypothetical protein